MSKHFGYGSGGSLRFVPKAFKMDSVSKINLNQSQNLQLKPPIFYTKRKVLLKSDSSNSMFPVNKKKRIKLTAFNFGLAGLIGEIVSPAHAETNSSVASNKILVKTKNKTEFLNSISATQEAIVKNIIEKITSVNASHSNLVDIDVGDITSADANINIDVSQTLKIVNFSELKEDYVKQLTSSLAAKLIDDIINSIETNQLTNLTASAANEADTNLVDSLVRIVNSNPPTNPTLVKNILTTENSTVLTDKRNALITKILNATNFTKLIVDIVTTTKNHLAVKYNNITVTNFKFTLNSTQLSDVEMKLKTDTKILVNIIEQFEKTKEFKFEQNIKNALDNKVASTAASISRSEQVSGLASSFVSAFTWPVAVAIGGVGIVGAFVLFGNGIGGKKLNNLSTLMKRKVNGEFNASAANGAAGVEDNCSKQFQFTFC